MVDRGPSASETRSSEGSHRAGVNCPGSHRAWVNCPPTVSCCSAPSCRSTLSTCRGARPSRVWRQGAIDRNCTAAAFVAYLCLLRLHGAIAAEPNYDGRILKTPGNIGSSERGVELEDGRFWPGTTGSEWTKPLDQDLLRVERKDGKKFTDWEKTSWQDVNCCRRLTGNGDWEDEETGVPNCFCRDLLQYTGYKTTAVCNLKQACENALRDFNKVFGEGYMAEGEEDDWNTESPLRTCTSSRSRGRATHESCGVPSSNKNDPPFEDEPWKWVDPFGRGPVFEQSEPSKWYGKKGGEDKNPRKAKSTGFKWVPGDVPVGDGDDVKKWQGYKAANGAVEEGLMAGSRVYPGHNHSSACIQDANSTECMNSARMKWTGPEDSYQADCMFAVKRAICAYHFWECDASYGTKIYNGICEPTCTDIPKLCGSIPSTGEPLEVKRFTLGSFYYLGCTTRRREYVKDCTAGSARVFSSSFPTSMLAVISTVFTVFAAGIVFQEGALM